MKKRKQHMAHVIAYWGAVLGAKPGRAQRDHHVKAFYTNQLDVNFDKFLDDSARAGDLGFYLPRRAWI